MILVQKKRCGDCGRVKPSSDFTRLPRTRDGLQNICKPCKAARQREYYRRRKADPAYQPRPRNQNNVKVKRRKQVSRRPLTDFARDAGWSLRKDIERLERIFADGRFHENKQQVAAHLRGHLKYAAEVCQDLLSQLDETTGA